MSDKLQTWIPQSLPEKTWQEQMAAHQRQLDPWVTPHLKRHELEQEHAVYDFLFSYYSFRASLLMRWSPGVEFLLEGSGADSFLDGIYYKKMGNKVGLDPERFPIRRLEAAQWVLTLLEKTSARPPQYGCIGLHEWAMEYESTAKRYPEIPLRMEAKDLKQFVDSQDLRCSHYDAFRFFTPAAKPLNSMEPRKITQPDFEQTGCLHVNMDLYKWSYKFYPWIGSNVIAEAFFLALRAREIDMRASPYNLTYLGFEPIRIETPAGRAEYQNLQSTIFEKSIPIRKKLTDSYRKLIEWVQFSCYGGIVNEKPEKKPQPEKAKPKSKDKVPAPAKPSVENLTKEEQMALYEKDLKENDWGHQPC